MNNLDSRCDRMEKGNGSRPNWLAAVLWRNPRLLARFLRLVQSIRTGKRTKQPILISKPLPRQHAHPLPASIPGPAADIQRGCYPRRLPGMPTPSRRSLPIAAATAACSLGAAALLLSPLGPRPAGASSFQIPALRSSTSIMVADGQVIAAPDGLCSLIEAIHNANDTATGLVYADCAAGSPGLGDMISLPAGGDFTLTAADNSTYGPSGLPVISDLVTIQSPTTATIHRDPAAEPFRVLAVGREGRLVLEQVTISGGRTPDPARAADVTYATMGGGALNLGALRLNDAVISGNTAFAGGGVYNGGKLYGGGTFSGNNAGLGSGDALLSFGDTFLLNSPLFTGNGDAYFGSAVENEGEMTLLGAQFGGNLSAVSINNRGEVTIRDSQFTGAYTAIANVGKATIEGTLLSGNGTAFSNFGTALIDRAAVVDNNWGLINNEGVMTLVNSTVSGNHSPGDGGGVLVNGGRVVGYFNTLSDNSAERGGGVFVSGRYTLYSTCIAGYMTLNYSILSGNEAGAGPEAYVEQYSFRCRGSLSLNHTIVGHDSEDGTVNAVLYLATIAGEPLGSIIEPALSTDDPQSPVHRLPLGSPAVDTLSERSCSLPLVNQIDQRGQPRTVDGDGRLTELECDVGAFERQPFAHSVFVPVAGAMEVGP